MNGKGKFLLTGSQLLAGTHILGSPNFIRQKASGDKVRIPRQKLKARSDDTPQLHLISHIHFLGQHGPFHRRKYPLLTPQAPRQRA